MGPLFIKTDNSLLKSLIKIPDLIVYALKHNVKVLGIVDDSLFGAMEFYNACKNNGIKPIIGLDVLDVYLFAKNYNGYQNLLKIATIKSEQELNINILKQYSSDLICVLKNNSNDYYFYEDVFATYQDVADKKNNYIYCNEVLYLEESDFNYYKCLKAIDIGCELKDVNVKNNHNHFLNYTLYEDDNKIIDMCDLELPTKQDLLPIYPCEDSYTYLKELVLNGLNKLELNQDKYLNRIDHELEIIKKMDFCNYFLVVWDYVKFAKKNDIYMSVRGSAAGSLVSYCLGITNIDPLKYDLYFERFLNPERISMPDIDIDFEYTKRDMVIKYCTKKYGLKKVAPIITFGTLGSKQVIRDVGKILNIDSKTIDLISKKIDSRLSLKDNYQNIKEYLTGNSENLYKISLKLEGLKRHTSVHAAGVVMSRCDLDEIIPLYKHDDLYLTGFSMEYLEEIGLLKMDLLALKNLTLLNNCLKELNIEIPLNDILTLELFKEGNTSGIFQFESEGMIKFLKKLKISNFNDIVAAIALYRPGPMQFIDSYINRKNNLENVDFITPTLKPILESTYGIVIYQEQIMKIANVMANYSLGEADLLRKAMSKKNESIMLKEKDKFITNSIKNGYSNDIAVKTYETIKKFALYGFNKAHSVSYSLIAYQMAYIKAHYPNIFAKHFLSMVIGSDNKITEYITSSNLKIEKPDINFSDLQFIMHNESLIYPFTNIKGVGKSYGNIIVTNRNYSDIYDFFKKCGNKLNKTIITNLIKADCFRSFGYNQKTLDDNLDTLINYSEFGELLEESLKPEIIKSEEYSKQELYNREVEVLGMLLSTHPAIAVKKKYNCVDIKNIKDYFDKICLFAIVVESVRKVSTKNGQNMAFIKGNDETGNGEFVLFPRNYQEIHTGSIYIVKGKVEKRFDNYQIIIEKVKTVNFN